MAGGLPRLAIRFDLLPLLNVQRLTGLVEFQRRTLQIHAARGGPLRGGVRGGAPPDAVAQAFGVWLGAEKPGWVREHGRGIRPREPFASDDVEKLVGMTPRQIGVGLTVS